MSGELRGKVVRSLAAAGVPLMVGLIILAFGLVIKSRRGAGAPAGGEVPSFRGFQKSEVNPDSVRSDGRFGKMFELPPSLAPEFSKHKSVTFAITAGVQGELEPCGCTKPPLGGQARRVSLVGELARSFKDASAWIDGGDLLFPPPSFQIAFLKESYERRAAILLAQLRSKSGVFCIGEQDLQDGGKFLDAAVASEPVTLVLTNVQSPMFVHARPLHVVAVGGLRVAVLNVMDKSTFVRWGLSSHGFTWTEPVASALEALKQAGPPVDGAIVAVHTENRALMKALADKIPQTFCIVSAHAERSDPREVKIGNAVAVSLQERGTHMAFAHFKVLGPGPLYDLNRLHVYDGWVADYEARRKGYDDRQLPKTHPDYLALEKKIAEYQVLQKTELDRARISNLGAVTQVALDHHVEADEIAVKDIEAFTAWMTRSAPESSTTAGEAQRLYIGASKCGECHQEQYKWWAGTKHAHALETLKPEDRRNRECLSCHVTGFVELEGRLSDGDLQRFGGVQCETCHGSGADHPPKQSKRTVPSALCVVCHNRQRDPKFDFGVYQPKACCPKKS